MRSSAVAKVGKVVGTSAAYNTPLSRGCLARWCGRYGGRDVEAEPSGADVTVSTAYLTSFIDLPPPETVPDRSIRAYRQ
jgi:hypothetical protein